MTIPKEMINDGVRQIFLFLLLSAAVSSSFHQTIDQDEIFSIPGKDCEPIDDPLHKILDYSLLKSKCNIMENKTKMKIEVTFSDIEPNLLKNLPTIEILQANFLHFSRISLVSYNLRFLNVSNNELKLFKLYVFENLEILDLSNNKLKKISLSPKNEERSNLEILNLSHNDIEELYISPSFNELKLIDLSNNKIEIIPKNMFSHMKKLTSINLSSNELSSLPHCLLCGLENLEKLDLSFNRIKILNGMLLEPLKNLKIIDLKGNKIEHFYDEVAIGDVGILEQTLMCTSNDDFYSREKCIKIGEPEKICCGNQKKSLQRRSLSTSHVHAIVNNEKIRLQIHPLPTSHVHEKVNNKKISLQRRSLPSSHFHATVNNKKMSHNVSAIASRKNQTNNDTSIPIKDLFGKFHNMSIENVKTSLNETLKKMDSSVTQLENQYISIMNKIDTDLTVVNFKLSQLNDSFNDIFLKISNANGENVTSIYVDQDFSIIEKNYEDITYILTLCLFLLVILVFLGIFGFLMSIRRNRESKKYSMGLLNLEAVEHQ